MDDNKAMRSLEQALSSDSDTERSSSPISAPAPALVQSFWRRWWQTNSRGYRYGILLSFAFSALVLIVNLALLLTTVSLRSTKIGDSSAAQRILYEGDCAKARRSNVALHFVINALSTVILASSSYCMQCLVSPTRDEVNVAHSRQRWLDIGVPGLRNLRYIGKKRVALWALLGVTSLPLHLFYNSAVFSSVAVRDYNILTASEDFLHTSGRVDFDIKSVDPGNIFIDPVAFAYESTLLASRLRSLAQVGALERLSPSDCIRAYSNALTLPTKRANLLIIEDRDTTRVNRMYPPAIVSVNGSVSMEFNMAGWMCSQIKTSSPSACPSHAVEIRQAADDWSPFDGRVQYCLSEVTAERCRLQSSLHISVLVILLNVVKVTIMGYMVFADIGKPLLTIGDAISTFMSDPDPFTKGLPLVSKLDFERHHSEWGPLRSAARNKLAIPKRVFLWTVSSKRRFIATSPIRWLLTLLMILCSLVTISGLLAFAFRTDLKAADSASASGVASLGLGSPDSRTLIIWGLPTRGTAALLSNALAANAPQAILSILYFAYNALFTAMATAAEWASFATTRKGLRVSTNQPRGAQVSTRALQLPLRSALALGVGSAVLHWLISQSLFLVYLETYDVRGRHSVLSDLVTCGYSPLAMIWTLIGGAVMLVLVVLEGSRHLPGDMPVAGSCSAAIAAACQVRRDGAREPEDVYRPLRWGRLLTGKGEGQCGFSAHEVGDVEDEAEKDEIGD